MPIFYDPIITDGQNLDTHNLFFYYCSITWTGHTRDTYFCNVYLMLNLNLKKIIPNLLFNLWKPVCATE